MPGIANILSLKLGWLAGLAFVLALAIAAPAMAQTAPADSSGSTTAASCKDYVGVTNRMASCIRETVSKVSAQYFEKFYPLVASAIAAFFTLGVVIYGVMLASGMVERISRDTMMLLIKIALAGFFSQNADLMYDYATRGMDAAGTVMVKAAPRNGIADGNTDFSQIQCMQNFTQASEEKDKPVVGPWVAMDCLIDTVIGIKTDTAGATTITTEAGKKAYNEKISLTGLKRGMIYFFFSGMQTSVVGLILAVIGFVFIWGLVAMIIKSLMTYIAGYIGLSFMMIIAPLFIPLVLFRHTKEYFDKWVKLTLSFAMQPVLILLFISMSVAAVDLAMFSGQYSVMYRIAGEKSRQSGFNLNTYLTSNGAIVKKPLTAAYVKTSNTNCNPKLVASTAESAIQGLARVVDSATGKAADAACKAGMPLQTMRDTIDWDKLASIRSPAVKIEGDATSQGQQLLREVLSAVIFCGVVIFVMNKMMSVVPHVLVDLIGDIGQTPNVFRTTTDGWNKTAESLSGQISGGLTHNLKENFAQLSGRRGSP